MGSLLRVVPPERWGCLGLRALASLRRVVAMTTMRALAGCRSSGASSPAGPELADLGGVAGAFTGIRRRGRWTLRDQPSLPGSRDEVVRESVRAGVLVSPGAGGEPPRSGTKSSRGFTGSPWREDEWCGRPGGRPRLPGTAVRDDSPRRVPARLAVVPRHCANGTLVQQEWTNGPFAQPGRRNDDVGLVAAGQPDGPMRHSAPFCAPARRHRESLARRPR